MNKFPLEMFPQIEANPEDFKLLKRVPLTSKGVEFPILTPHEDLSHCVRAVVIDTETTGYSCDTEVIIELGLVGILVDPETGDIKGIEKPLSMYEQPPKPIPEEVTEVTGITDEMVAGHKIDNDAVHEYLSGDPILIAHNAKFDRGFFDKRFPALTDLQWGCSLKQVDWSQHGVTTRALEGILSKLGYFYDAHRAETDCLATIWGIQVIHGAMPLLKEVYKDSYLIKALGSPFQVKDELKKEGFKWVAERKVWQKEVEEEEVQKTLDLLTSLYFEGGERASVLPISARERFKP